MGSIARGIERNMGKWESMEKTWGKTIVAKVIKNKQEGQKLYV